MKIFKFITLNLLGLLLSGCSLNHMDELENQNMRQVTIINQQSQEIQRLQREVLRYRTQKDEARQKWIEKQKAKKLEDKTIEENGLKKVEDTNYSSKYMYPQTKKKKVKSTKVVISNTKMTKTECISMITQTRFDRYTQMLGSEEASLKRCEMLKAMR